MTLRLYRDPAVYGDIHFKLWNFNEEEAVTQTKVTIEGFEAISDENGMVSLFIPLEMQRKAYKITTDVPLVTDSIFMPCGDDDVILVK